MSTAPETAATSPEPPAPAPAPAPAPEPVPPPEPPPVVRIAAADLPADHPGHSTDPNAQNVEVPLQPAAPVVADTICPNCGRPETVLATATAATPEATPAGPDGEPIAAGSTLHLCNLCGHLLEVFEDDVAHVVDELEQRRLDQADQAEDEAAGAGDIITGPDGEPLTVTAVHTGPERRVAATERRTGTGSRLDGPDRRSGHERRSQTAKSNPAGHTGPERRVAATERRTGAPDTRPAPTEERRLSGVAERRQTKTTDEGGSDAAHEA